MTHSCKKMAIKNKILPFLTTLLFLFVPIISYAQDFSNTDIKFKNYDDLVEYTEDFIKKEVHYKYTTELVPQKTNNNYIEQLSKRQSDKEFYINPETLKTQIKIYSGDNYAKKDNDWYQLEYATTTETIFFDEIDKMIPPKNWFDKLTDYVSFYNIKKVKADQVFNSFDGEVYRLNESTWTSARDTSTGEGTQDASYLFTAGDKDGSTYDLFRTFLSFDTDGILGVDEQISSTSFFVYLYSAPSTVGDTVLVESTHSNPLSLSTGDFNKAGTLDNPTELADRLNVYTNGNGYQQFAFYESALSIIDTGDDDGYTQIAMRDEYDVDDITPTARSYVFGRPVTYTGTDYDPYLLIDIESSSTSTESTASCTPIIIVGGMIQTFISLFLSLFIILIISYEPARKFAGLG